LLFAGLPLLLLVAGGIGFAGYSAIQNQRSLFVVNYSNGQNLDEDLPYNSLEWLLPFDKRMVPAFEERLLKQLGTYDKLYVYEDPWFRESNMKTAAQIEELTGWAADNYPPVYVFLKDGYSYYLTNEKGTMSTNIDGPSDTWESIDILHYEIMINEDGQYEDISGHLKEIRKIIKSLIDEFYDSEYQKQYPY